jgi:sugar fermentation stimulation protein A
VPSFPPLLEANFVSRPNRYLIIAERDGRHFETACRDPGRLGWLLHAGVALRLRHAPGPARRTAFDVVLARRGASWVSLLPTLANQLFEEAIVAGRAPGLRGARVLRREVTHGESRFDFLLRHRGRDMLAEVKSVGLVERGRALFPDAPTERGARHVRELTAHARSGGDALLAFVVQGAGAEAIAPHAALDPEFAKALAEARRAKVRVLGFSCRITEEGAEIRGRLPVLLPR